MKKIVSLILAATMLFAFAATANAAVYPYEVTGYETRIYDDVDLDAWYANAVMCMSNIGWVNGYPDGNFGPSDTITREQLATIIARVNSYWLSGEVAENATYSDENGYWAYGAVSKGINEGYLVADGHDAVADPYWAEPITREEACYTLLKSSGWNFEAADYVPEIPDKDEINPAYLFEVITAYNAGYIEGVDELGTFNPTGILTRAEMCQIIFNMHLDTSSLD